MFSTADLISQRLSRLAGTAAAAVVRRGWAWAEQYGRFTSEDPGGHCFAHLGTGVSIGFPVAALYGTKWMSIGDATLVGCQVALTVGLLPGLDLGPGLVLRIGQGCVIGRGTHIVAHESVILGDNVFIAPYAYITDQNHTYADSREPIGRQPPCNRPVVIGDGCWLGAGVIVLPGTQLGRNVAVAAGSVVRGTFPDHCLIGGVPAKILRRHDDGAEQPKPPYPADSANSTCSTKGFNMQKSDHMLAVMIVGDSISHGSSGDWTWRYRLWKHFQQHGVAVDLVGPKSTLDNIRTAEPGDDDATYADPDFDRDHDAQWGRPYLTEKDEIEAKVREHRPEYLLVLLGINDLFWYGVEAPQFEANLREFITNAYLGNPGLRIVLGTVLQCQKAVDEPDFAARIDAVNERLRTVAKDVDSPGSPVAVAETGAEFVAAEHTWDGTHPNPNGEIRIAAAFADTLAARFGIGARYPRPYPYVPPAGADAKARID